MAALTKQATGVTADGLPVHSFKLLLVDLATLAGNTIVAVITRMTRGPYDRIDTGPAQAVRAAGGSVHPVRPRDVEVDCSSQIFASFRNRKLGPGADHSVW